MDLERLAWCRSWCKTRYVAAMTRAKTRTAARDRGGIEELPSGALRVKVYAGRDPITKKRHYLTETVSADTSNAEKEAEKIRTRFLSQVDERRHPRTNATVGQLLDRHFSRFNGAPSTLDEYRGLRRSMSTSS